MYVCVHEHALQLYVSVRVYMCGWVGGCGCISLCFLYMCKCTLRCVSMEACVCVWGGWGGEGEWVDLLMGGCDTCVCMSVYVKVCIQAQYVCAFEYSCIYKAVWPHSNPYLHPPPLALEYVHYTHKLAFQKPPLSLVNKSSHGHYLFFALMYMTQQ